MPLPADSIEGFSVAEVADALGLKPETVRKRLRRHPGSSVKVDGGRVVIPAPSVQAMKEYSPGQTVLPEPSAHRVPSADSSSYRDALLDELRDRASAAESLTSAAQSQLSTMELQVSLANSAEHSAQLALVHAINESLEAEIASIRTELAAATKEAERLDSERLAALAQVEALAGLIHRQAASQQATTVLSSSS